MSESDINKWHKQQTKCFLQLTAVFCVSKRLPFYTVVLESLSIALLFVQCLPILSNSGQLRVSSKRWCSYSLEEAIGRISHLENDVLHRDSSTVVWVKSNGRHFHSSVLTRQQTDTLKKHFPVRSDHWLPHNLQSVSLVSLILYSNLWSNL